MDKHSKKSSSLLHYPVLVVFSLFFIGLFALDLITPDRAYSEMENTTLSQRPALTQLSAKGLNSYFTAYTKYVKDQVFGRDNWISLQSVVETTLLQKEQNGGILLGKEHMMFPRTFGLLDSENRTLPKNTAAVEALCQRYPGKVNVMLVPAASVIYPENVPAGAPLLHEEPYLDQLSSAVQAAGGNAHQRLGLLIARVKGIVPDVVPGGKPAHGMGRDPQGQNTGNHQGGDGQGHRAHAAGAEIGDDEEGAEEDQRRAEVVHHRQAAADHHGIGDEGDQVALVHNAVHGGSAREHEAYLAQLRGLKGNIADDDPAFCAIVFRANRQGQQQEAQSRRHGQITHPLGPLQIPQRPAHQQVDQHAHHHGDQLLHRLRRNHSGNGRHAQGAQEEGQGLHLKGAAANDDVKDIQRPLGHDDPGKAPGHQGGVRHCVVQGEADDGQQLKGAKDQQVNEGGHRAGCAGAQLGLQLLLLLGNHLQLQLHPAYGQHVPILEGADAHPLPVDIGAVLGIGIGDGPAAVVIARQDGMTAGYGRIVEHHVAAGRAPDKALPVRHRDLLAGGRGKPRPHLRLPPEGQQGQDAAQKQYGAEYRYGIAKDSHIGACVVFLCQRQGFQNILHTITLLSSGNSYV